MLTHKQWPKTMHHSASHSMTLPTDHIEKMPLNLPYKQSNLAFSISHLETSSFPNTCRTGAKGIGFTQKYKSFL